MIIWNTFAVALTELRRNSIRSFLTALGIVIGVASVITMVHLGQGATRSVTDEIASLGQNLLIVAPGTRRRGPGGTRTSARPFAHADLEAIKRDVRGITAAPVVSHPATAVYGNSNWTTSIIGTTADYLTIRDWSVSHGRIFDPHELASGSRACVVGVTVAKELFGDRAPVGDTFRVVNLPCRVIGVLEEKGQSSMGNDQDDIILMPLRTVQRRLLGTVDIGQIMVSVTREDRVSATAEELRELLRERRKLAVSADDDFEVRDLKEIATMVARSTATLTALLGAIAGVSMLVGGIGIMNIMLVSVTERTREIGIRMALGARGREVLLQFLIEAILLSTLGGGIGIVLGLIGSFALARQLGMPFEAVPEIVVIAFVFSAFVGVLFGFLPARRAALLNPIEALRHE